MKRVKRAETSRLKSHARVRDIGCSRSLNNNMALTMTFVDGAKMRP